MEDILQVVLVWGYPLVAIILVVLAVTRKRIKGKPWLMAHLVGSLTVTLIWRAPSLLSKLNILDESSMSMFYDKFGTPLQFASFAVYCLLIPYVVAAARN